MKRIFSLLILAFAVHQIQAQGFKFGIKAGGNFTTNTSASFQENYKGGFHAGLFARIKASEIVGVQVEGLISSVKLSVTPNAAVFRNGLADLKATYIHIPILLNISPLPLISIQAGPQIGMTINQTKDALRVGGDALKNRDFSMLAGIQLNLSKLSVFGRYSFGLSDIKNVTTIQESWKSKMLQAGIGISL
jgi:hypothetical protein